MRHCNPYVRRDECDVGFDPRVTDANGNLVPDECEPDASSLSLAAVASGTRLETGAIVQAMDNWWANFDRGGLKAWQVAYAIKMKLAELGFDLRSTVSDGGTQP